MKKPQRQRRRAQVRRVEGLPVGIDLKALAAKATYGGSPYHKDIPSFAGRPPKPRPGASICPRGLAKQRDRVEKWLREAIEQGHVGLWQGDFPLRVWHREGSTVFEAVLTRSKVGEYHGYPLEPNEKVEGLP
ncbi:MAG: hypothetical protein GXY55_01600 [Phycisphaerae bacterium]|nr:hypothetical protein [Phycisphaerae bacterium]